MRVIIFLLITFHWCVAPFSVISLSSLPSLFSLLLFLPSFIPILSLAMAQESGSAKAPTAGPVRARRQTTWYIL